jgi:phenylalanyl-tRNA synthetase beta chain
MKISLDWLGDYLELPAAPTERELADELTLKTVEVEGWQHLGSDTVFEIDNKSLTNRPDLWGHHGIAREYAAIYRLPLSGPVPEALRVARPPARTGLIAGTVDPSVCRRLTVVELELGADGPARTPGWLAERLTRLGQQSTDALDDLAAYVMFATGQPVQLRAVTDDATTDDVASDDAPGVRRRLLEAETLDPAVVRRETHRLGVRTEASVRQEKGLDTQRVDQAIDLYLALLPAVAPGVRAVAMQDHDPDPTQRTEIELDFGYLDARMGVPIDPDEVCAILESLGFEVHRDGMHLRTLAPTWRSTGDVSVPEDVLEEVARIHGYASIPAAPLEATLDYLAPTELRPLDRRVREQLAARGGMQEVVTYAWAADRMLDAAGLDPSSGVALVDPPAPDRATLRASLVPNLLEAVASNLRHTAEFGLYEVGTTFDGTRTEPWAEDFEPLPVQRTHAAAVLVGVDGRELFLRMKGIVEMLARWCQIAELRLETEADAARAAGAMDAADTTDTTGGDARGPGWADRQARLALVADGRRVGTLALLGTRCRRTSGIGAVQVACFELNLDALRLNPTRENDYRPVSEWPESEFDLSIVVPEAITWAQLSASAASARGIVDRIGHLGEFRGGQIPAGDKSVTLRVSLRPRSGTLGGAEIAEARAAVIAALDHDLGARLRT